MFLNSTCGSFEYLIKHLGFFFFFPFCSSPWIPQWHLYKRGQEAWSCHPARPLCKFCDCICFPISLDWIRYVCWQLIPLPTHSVFCSCTRTFPFCSQSWLRVSFSDSSEYSVNALFLVFTITPKRPTNCSPWMHAVSWMNSCKGLHWSYWAAVQCCQQSSATPRCQMLLCKEMLPGWWDKENVLWHMGHAGTVWWSYQVLAAGFCRHSPEGGIKQMCPTALLSRWFLTLSLSLLYLAKCRA